jgi:antitoxin (DNA-binding transcriptional repressor) of toxin-antitoxin stability system
MSAEERVEDMRKIAAEFSRLQAAAQDGKVTITKNGIVAARFDAVDTETATSIARAINFARRLSGPLI